MEKERVRVSSGDRERRRSVGRRAGDSAGRARRGRDATIRSVHSRLLRSRFRRTVLGRRVATIPFRDRENGTRGCRKLSRPRVLQALSPSALNFFPYVSSGLRRIDASGVTSTSRTLHESSNQTYATSLKLVDVSRLAARLPDDSETNSLYSRSDLSFLRKGSEPTFIPRHQSLGLRSERSCDLLSDFRLDWKNTRNRFACFFIGLP